MIEPKSLAQKLAECIDTSSCLKSGFTGIAVYDAGNQSRIFSSNAEKYFVPASNVKLFTLLACLKTIGDSIPALKYTETDSTFTFWGTGDPTFLHPFFAQSKTFAFLKSKAQSKKLYFSDGHSRLNPYGSGWMWDDYNDYYQAEMASFPIYGNILYVKKDSTGLRCCPKALLFDMPKTQKQRQIKRNFDKNEFSFPSSLDSFKTFEQEVPYKNASEINIAFLEDTLGVKIKRVKIPVSHYATTIYSLPVDTVYRRMMQQSDNMLAEHLLLLCGMVIGDTISTTFSIDTIISLHMKNLSGRPAWVDGSGLSRYNLFTPASVIDLLLSMYKEVPREKLFSMMPKGGQSGTLRNMFKYIKTPYIFAKSGSMSGVYNLSGYMIAKSGRTIAFSLMNNNHNTPVSLLRKETERILKEIEKLL